VSATRYRIVVRGPVDAATLERIGKPEARPGAGLTELACDVIDQSQLVGLLCGLSGAGVEIVSARPIDPLARLRSL
jgi:hypothetical protein